jgi:hypothetical protein
MPTKNGNCIIDLNKNNPINNYSKIVNKTKFVFNFYDLHFYSKIDVIYYKLF